MKKTKRIWIYGKCHPKAGVWVRHEAGRLWITCRMCETLIAEIAVPSEVCKWQEDDSGTWESQCGNSFVINDGTPEENRMLFCCYCGGEIEQIQYQEAEVKPC